MHEGKPMKQSLAIAYAMKRKAKKMSDGGPVPDQNKVKGFVKGFTGKAMGGEMKSGYLPMPEEHEEMNEAAMHEDEMDMNQHPVHAEDSGEEGIVDRIMKRFSKGGQVANATPPMADKMPSEYDDLVLDDDLEFHDTGTNSGDELGNAQEDEDRKDIVSRIMSSRKKKDRNPRPA